MESAKDENLDESYNERAPNPSDILEIYVGEDNVVTLDLVNDLHEDPDEICVFLKNENADRSYWLAIATAYTRLNLVDSAIEVVKTGIDSICETEEDKLPFLSLLIWLYYRKLRDAPNTQTGETSPSDIKEEYHRLATTVANRIITLDRSSSVAYLARGELSILMGDYDRAMNSFKTVLSSSSDTNLFGHLGKARVLYSHKNYKGALKVYQHILRCRPNFKPDPRIGIGFCFWQLNEKDMALSAWQRALELDPENMSVNVLLGLYYMDEAVKNVEDPSFEATYVKALKYTQRAYQKNPNYAPADLVLASYLFSKKEIDSVIKLAKRSINYSKVNTIISDAYFWMARSYHYMDDLDEALKYYKLAEEKNPQSLVAKVGKGLVQMAQNDNETIYTFETIVQKHPKSTEAYFLLALAYVQRDHKDKAVAFLERFLRLVNEQESVPPVEALLMLSKLTENTNTTIALKTLTDVIQLLNEQEISVNAELYNNIGVLHYNKGSYDSARSFFELAATACSNKNTYNGEEISTTIKFNLARLEDANENFELAQKLYGELLTEHPDYLSARIRSSYLSLLAGETDSIDKVKDLMSQHSDNLEVRALYGYYLRRQKRLPARSINDDVEMKHYKYTLMNIDKHDSYSLVAMANMYLSVARSLRATSNEDIQKKEWTYSKAAELFEKALYVDKSNAFAAQGVAIIFAETKQSDKALHIFNKIRETLDDVSVYTNLGSCLVDLRQYAKAIECYEIALNRFKNGNDSQLLIYLGRAWYVRGMYERNLEALKTSLDYTERALEMLPGNSSLKFNIAFLRFKMADFILKLPERERTTSDIEKAISGLEVAIVSMNEISSAKHPPYPPKELEARANMGQNTTMKQLERILVSQKEYEIKFHDKIDQAKKIREAEKAKLEQEKRAKLEAEAEREALLVKERMQLQEQAREWTEKNAFELENASDKEEEKPARKKEPRERKPRQKKEKGKGEKGERKKAKDKGDKESKKSFKSVSDIEDSDEGLGDFGDESMDGSSEESAHETDTEAPARQQQDNNDDLFGDDEEDDSNKRKSPEPEADESNSGHSKKRRTGRIVDDDDEE